MKTKLTLLMSCGLLLSACGGGAGGLGDTNIFRVAAGTLVKQTVAKRQAGKATPTKVTQASIANAKSELMKVQVPNLGLTTIAAKISNNNDYVNYRTAADQSFTTKNGHLTSTNGLQFDLMATGTNSGAREYRYITSINSTSLLRVNCEITSTSRETVTVAEIEYNTRLTEETCKSSSTAFKNKIWVDANGKPRKAHQWIGFRAGFAIIEWLN